MPPKKATAAQFLVKAQGQGEYFLGTEGKTGEFRVSVNTDLAQVVINVGPDNLEDWNPVTLVAYSFRYLRGGSHLRISFQTSTLQWKGELELNVFGGLAGKFEGPGGESGKVTGLGTVELARDHVCDIPRPTKALAEKLQKEPHAVRWEAPACLGDGGAVVLLGLGGPSKTGKSVLAKALSERLREQGREVCIVEQTRYEHCVGQYACSAGVNESMFENPSAVNWPELVKAISKAIDGVSAAGTPEAPSFVILEGTLVFYMPQICQAMRRRIFLRCSQDEVLRRRQATATLAEPFVEHVFWPMHLQYGQPQAAWEEIRIEDGDEGYPVPEALLSEALGAVGFGIKGATAEDAAPAAPADGEAPAEQAEAVVEPAAA